MTTVPSPTPSTPGLREVVAGILAEHGYSVYVESTNNGNGESLPDRDAADAVLAAVTPEIRRQVAEQIAGAIERDPRITRQPRRLAASVARLHVVANPQLPEPLPAIQGLPEPAYFCAPEDGTDV